MTVDRQNPRPVRILVNPRDPGVHVVQYSDNTFTVIRPPERSTLHEWTNRGWHELPPTPGQPDLLGLAQELLDRAREEIDLQNRTGERITT
jgi:hypothetical protein